MVSIIWVHITVIILVTQSLTKTIKLAFFYCYTPPHKKCVGYYIIPFELFECISVYPGVYLVGMLGRYVIYSVSVQVRSQQNSRGHAGHILLIGLKFIMEIPNIN